MSKPVDKETPYSRHREERIIKQSKYYYSIYKPNQKIEKKSKFEKAEKKYLINEFVFSVSD
jgi:hypothetical protein